MYYKLKLKDYIALQPDLFEEDLKTALKEQIVRDYSNKVSSEFGFVVSTLDIIKVGEGFKLPEDPSRHYIVEFEVITYILEMHEFSIGEVTSITDFGAFVDLGPIEGLIHLSQIMVDQCSVSNTGNIQGTKTGNTLKVGDLVKSSLVAISFKDLQNIKIGLTMRQPGLGLEGWAEA